MVRLRSFAEPEGTIRVVFDPVPLKGKTGLQRDHSPVKGNTLRSPD